MLDLTISSITLLAGAVFFANSVERLGEELGLTKFATGALLAAGITALPETILALGSAFVGSPASQEVGEGSVVAAPSITLLAAAPFMMLLSRRVVNHAVAGNYRAFAVLFPASIAFGLYPLPRIAKLSAGLVMLFLFVLIGRRLVKSGGEEMVADEEAYLERLFRRRGIVATATQTVFGASMMYVGADLFIYAASKFSDPFVVALLISPFATCLEETLVAAYWAARGKFDLAMSLVSGENTIQATLVVGVGMLTTPWILPSSSVVVTFLYICAAVSYALLLTKSWLVPSVLGLGLYILYLVLSAHTLLD
jgi:Ca2+/Na+ antiporter